MKKQILLLVCAGLMQSLVANDPATENTGLIQNTDEESQTVLHKQPINWTKLCVKGFCLWIGMGLLGTGAYAFNEAFTPGESGGFEIPHYPPCKPFVWNHTKAPCTSYLPSQMWITTCEQLGAMEKLSEQTCVPGCSFNIHENGPVFDTGSREETRLPQEELIRFQESPYDEYEYVICENKPDSWLHTLKSRLANMSIPFWTTKNGTRR